MLKELLNYQPDLAIKLLAKADSRLFDSDMVSSVASVTAWVMDPKNIITLFETKMLDYSKRLQFIQQILIQDDKSAEILFSLSKDANDFVNRYKDEFSHAQIEKANFLKKGFRITLIQVYHRLNVLKCVDLKMKRYLKIY